MKIADLKPGMLIEGVGLLVGVDTDGNDRFWQNRPNIAFICLNDPYNGEVHREVREDEDFTVLVEQGTVQYMSMLVAMMLERSEAKLDAERDILAIKKYMHASTDEREKEGTRH